MKTKTVYLVKHKAQNFSKDERKVEVIVSSPQNFLLWLGKHNLQRLEDGYLVESKNEFSLTEAPFFW